MAALHEMVRFTDGYLRLAEIEDYPNALNGLQIETGGEVTKMGRRSMLPPTRSRWRSRRGSIFSWCITVFFGRGCGR